MKVGFQKKSKFFLILGLLAVTASSCVLPAPRPVSSNQPQGQLFRPPTIVPTLLPASGAGLLSTSQPNAQPGECTDGLTFISDLSIPDGTKVAPASRIDKRWEVENSGTCDWSGKYRLKLIAGTEMGLQPLQALLQLRSGSRNTIRMMFTAPKEPGTYRSAWQAYNPDGVPFGDPVYIEVVVEESAPTPTP